MGSGKIQPVILCGGSGERLWPLSRTDNAKPFHAFINNSSLFAQTLNRVKNTRVFDDPVIVCGRKNLSDVRDVLQAENITATIVIEPAGRNTAPALAAACFILEARQTKNNPVLLMPSDHHLAPEAEFTHAVQATVPLCNKGKFILFGIPPEAAQPGYGYIIADPIAPRHDCLPVKRFIEKPDRKTAGTLISQKNTYWNSGIFLLKPHDYLAALQQHHPDSYDHIKKSCEGIKTVNQNETEIGPSFCYADNISIDRAIMEKTGQAMVCPASFNWADLGSWQSLWNADDKDRDGNVTKGTVIATNCQNSYLHTQGPALCAVNLKNITAVATRDAIFLAPIKSAPGIKQTLRQIRQHQPELLEISPQKNYHWGQRKILETTDSYTAIEYTIDPGQTLAAEYLLAGQGVVTAGTATVLADTKRIVFCEGVIPVSKKDTAMIKNEGDETLTLVHIQFLPNGDK